jgi:hypothetical protein
MAESRSNRAIARELVLTEKTVETLIASIFGKLDILPSPTISAGSSRFAPGSITEGKPRTSQKQRLRRLTATAGCGNGHADCHAHAHCHCHCQPGLSAG